ncbi:alpha/beta-hydrolase family protein [Gordonia sp. HY285]|uniref:alpha/beta-hydrolase family protein n=1 Tax=Gordonia liuliyuniae TaxID=2911517 RepID=UPI001F42E397|nr:alpha/beta-hydrolase family protein [Gordonia liuliyuniae]MCF8611503.1 alpha/beta-hydrolase family protein [Gordonia liuliyuniae]
MIARVHPAVVVGGVAGWALALAPGQLPRPALLLAVAGAVFALLGMGVGALVSMFTRGRTASRELLVGTAVVTGGLLVAALWWQTRVCEDLGAPSPGLGWAAAVAGAPLLAAGAVVLIPARALAIGALLTALVAGPAATANAAAPNIPDDPRLTYSMLSDDTFDDRARALVDSWAASDGPDQTAVVVAVPTGSGWIDASAVDGFVSRFGGSVRFLAMQYSNVPSWQAYLRSPDTAGASAIAVLRALDEQSATLPNPPHVYLYGQSLGAIGADAARAWADRTGVDVAGTVLSGAPAGSVESLPECARRVSIANATDPVADFQASLLWRAPHHAGGTRTIGTTPSARPPWTPVVSFVGTALDLAVSLDGPVGSGHHYGAEQGLAVTQMPGGCQATGPRAAS